ncbi:SOSS complex subunit B1, variant 2 [Entomophthora muscae]|uniref:SOSS complex subunit B1, variant 2 n=1 Tax=Entomophthora muscae TaxID=34485 RepID=A0ACC2SY62_9FUNG|nr:SOSS complex subunit B1, variant 2 [Entomophthora muscae]
MVPMGLTSMRAMFFSYVAGTFLFVLISIIKGYLFSFVKQFADFIYLNMSRSGKVIRIRSFTLLFSEMPNLSREFEIPEDYQPPRKLMNGNNKMHSGAPTSSRPPYTPYTRGQSNSSKYYSHQRSNRDRI